MISTAGLSRSFDGRPAVVELTMQVPEGQLCALLGPNGAGKTTTVRMLLGLLPPSSGSAEVAGVSLPARRDQAASLRARAGLLTETPGFYDRLSGRENLEFFARLYRIPDPELRPRIDSWLRRLGLWDAKDRPFGTYSKGMKQRLALIRAVFHEPRVIFLDEPTAGLDPAAARDVRTMIASLRGEGRTILLCTHHLGEAEELADLIGIMQQRLLQFGSLRDLEGEAAALTIRFAEDPSGFLELAKQIPGIDEVIPEGMSWEVNSAVLARVTPILVARLAEAGARILEVRPRRASLEQAYLRAVGRE